MNKLEFLKNEIAKLPPSMLVEVEGFVRKKKKEMKSRQRFFQIWQNARLRMIFLSI
jgi:hypothetical protein